MTNPNDRWLRLSVVAASILSLLAGSAFYARQLVVRHVHHLDESFSLWLAALAILIAGAFWLAIVWILIQVWEKRMLKTSLYNAELDQLIMSDASERLNRF